MRKFLKKIILFSLTIIGVIFISYLAATLLIFNLGFLKVNENISVLVLGDSHTESAINDFELKKTINLSSSADSYFYSYLKLRAISQKNPNIKTVIIALSYHNLTKEIEDRWMNNNLHIIDRFYRYCYYLKPKDFLMMMMKPIAIINSSLEIPKYAIQLGVKLLLGRANPYELNIGKYKNHEKNILNEEIIRIREIPKKDYILSEKETNYLMKITNFCDENKLNLIFISTPQHYAFNESISNEEKECFNQFYKENLNKFKFYDFSEFQLSDDCFTDLVHLNNKGSSIFTKYFKIIE